MFSDVKEMEHWVKMDHKEALYSHKLQHLRPILPSLLHR